MRINTNLTKKAKLSIYSATVKYNTISISHVLSLAYAQASQQIKYFQYPRLKLKLLKKTPMSWGIIFNYVTTLRI